MVRALHTDVERFTVHQNWGFRKYDKYKCKSNIPLVSGYHPSRKPPEQKRHHFLSLPRSMHFVRATPSPTKTRAFKSKIPWFVNTKQGIHKPHGSCGEPSSWTVLWSMNSECSVALSWSVTRATPCIFTPSGRRHETAVSTVASMTRAVTRGVRARAT